MSLYENILFMVIATQEFNNIFSTKSAITQFIKEWLHWNKNKTKCQPPIQSSFLKVILRLLIIKLLVFVARHKLQKPCLKNKKVIRL